MFLNNKTKKLLSNTFITFLSVLLLVSSFKSNHIFSNYELICTQFKSYFIETNSDSKENLIMHFTVKNALIIFLWIKKYYFLILVLQFFYHFYSF